MYKLKGSQISMDPIDFLIYSHKQFLISKFVTNMFCFITRHIEEDLGLTDIDESNLTDEELEFRYFM